MIRQKQQAQNVLGEQDQIGQLLAAMGLYPLWHPYTGASIGNRQTPLIVENKAYELPPGVDPKNVIAQLAQALGGLKIGQSAGPSVMPSPNVPGLFQGDRGREMSKKAYGFEFEEEEPTTMGDLLARMLGGLGPLAIKR